MGECLVAFRDSDGKIGLLDEFCPHRRASLYFGRNEACGLRCVYHGWKFDVDGQCVDMMNEPPELDFKAKIRLQSYPTIELGGIIWAYMGQPEPRPPLPKFAWTQVPQQQRHVSKVWQECNWLQALEGGIDTSHAPILHRRITTNTTRPGINPNTAWVQGKAPHLELDVTDYGYLYAGRRELEDGDQHIRAYHFVLPFHQLRPGHSSEEHDGVSGHIGVPMDDENCMVYNWQYIFSDHPLTEEDRLEERLGNGPWDIDQKTFRSFQNRDNNYMLDRQVQKYETFIGIDGINLQDRAIIQARRLLLQAIKTTQEGGTPRGVEPTYSDLRAGEGIIPGDADWRQLVQPELSSASTS